MADEYHELLDAAIGHVQELKAHGVRHLSVEARSLAALAGPVRTRAAVSAPVKPMPPAAPAISPRPAPAPQPPVAPPPAVISNFTPLSPEKEKAFAELRARALACVKCPHLASSRKSVVFGVGDLNAELMFVGEAPGADEDALGEPFVGAAGQLLTKIIQTMGLSRERVYIANILKCRPDTPGQSAGNRKPTPQEMDSCKPYLLEQIELIQPRVLVALGGTAMEGLLNKSGIMKLRGQWHTYHGVPLMPTFHPSYLLHNQVLAEKRKVWEDMLQVMEKLGMPVSDKQRGYFLSK
ncbi:MAG: uracil-DNA glycosylase [Verrucomicrobia bacterium]|nr:uracil-DNA glycosylase [Verrucomicrobiota bacterium]